MTNTQTIQSINYLITLHLLSPGNKCPPRKNYDTCWVSWLDKEKWQTDARCFHCWVAHIKEIFQEGDATHDYIDELDVPYFKKEFYTNTTLQIEYLERLK